MATKNDPTAAARKESRELREHLRTLTAAVAQFNKWIDAEMRAPSTPERGKRIAQAVGALEMANDRAMHFGLGVPLDKCRSGKRPGENSAVLAHVRRILSSPDPEQAVEDIGAALRRDARLTEAAAGTDDGEASDFARAARLRALAGEKE